MAGPLTISNTTPLINFAEIERVDLLLAVFGDLVISPAVRDELEAKPMLFPKAAEITRHSRLSIIEPSDQLLLRATASRVHQGEAECLVLAMERPGSMVLLDDLAAREIALANGILFMGTLGCLAEAKRQGLITAVKPFLHELRTKARFWVSDRLARRVLQNAGEE